MDDHQLAAYIVLALLGACIYLWIWYEIIKSAVEAGSKKYSKEQLEILEKINEKLDK